MSSEVGSGPQADICSLSVRCPLLPKSQLAGQLGLWNGDTERFLELKLLLGRRLHRQVRGHRSFENAIEVICRGLRVSCRESQGQAIFSQDVRGTK